MHSEILNDRQTELLPLMAQFRREYYLVGGTAIALYLGHRRSIDFDLFKPSAINHKRNLDKIAATPFTHTVTRRVAEQMNLIVNDVKLTFFQYPFPVEPTGTKKQFHFESRGTGRLAPGQRHDSHRDDVHLGGDGRMGVKGIQEDKKTRIRVL